MLEPNSITHRFEPTCLNATPGDQKLLQPASAMAPESVERVRLRGKLDTCFHIFPQADPFSGVWHRLLTGPHHYHLMLVCAYRLRSWTLPAHVDLNVLLAEGGVHKKPEHTEYLMSLILLYPSRHLPLPSVAFPLHHGSP